MTLMLRGAGIVVLTLLGFLAGLSIVGRLVLANAPFFEPWVNERFAASETQVVGLDGDWFRFNPVITIEQVKSPLGTAHQVYFELDLFESLIKWNLVARRLFVQNIEIFLEQPGKLEQSFQLPPNWFEDPFLVDSDRIHIETLGIAIQTARQSHYYVGSVSASEQDGSHVFRADLKSLTCDDCMVHIALDISPSGPGKEETLGILEVDVKNFPLHPDLVGVAALPELLLSIEFDGQRFHDHVNGLGRFELIVGTEDTSRIEAELGVGSDVGIPTAILRDIVIETPNQKSATQPVYIQEVEDSVQIWTESLNLETVSDLLVDVTAESSEIGTWLSAIALKGSLQNPVLLWDRVDETAIHGILTDIEFNSHEDLPGIQVESAIVSGDLRFPKVDVQGSRVEVHVAKQFSESWEFQNVIGGVQFHLEQDRASFIVQDVSGSYLDQVIRYKLGFSRDNRSGEFQVSHISGAEINGLNYIDGLVFVPKSIAQDMAEWIDSHILSGTFHEYAFLHHYYQPEFDGQELNDMLLRVGFDDASIEFLQGWPKVSEVSGDLFVIQDTLRVDLLSGTTFSQSVDHAIVRMPFDSDVFELDFSLQTDPNTLIRYVLATDLRHDFTAVKNSWVGSGDVGLDAELTLSLEGDSDRNDFKLNFDLQSVQLGDTEIGLYFDGLVGQVLYESPYRLSGNNINGSMFDKPLQVNISHDEDSTGTERSVHFIHFDFMGQADDSDIYELTGIPDMGYTEGVAPLFGRYTVTGEGSLVPKLTVHSDLTGLEIKLPGTLGKMPEVEQASQVEVVFEDAATAIDFKTGAFQGWLDMFEGDVLRGFVGVNYKTTPRQASISNLTITGSIPEWEYGGGSFDLGDLQELRLEGLDIGVLRIAEIDLTDVALNGMINATKWQIDFVAHEASGSIEQPNDDLMKVQLDHFHWQSEATYGDESEEESDPLDPSITHWLVPMHAVIDQLGVVSEGTEIEDFGAWDFKIHPSSDGLMISELTGDIKGLHIETTSEAFWDTVRNVSQFEVSITGTDLGEVLTAWGYDTQMVSERFEMEGSLFWDGSPLAYSLVNASGTFTATSRDGRFLEVEPNPGLRIVSLLNISTIAERLQLDFGDVLLKGYAYEDISLGAVADKGILRFDAPLRVKGRHSELRMQGSVNMRSEELNLELIATLPLSKALPWYSAAIAVANPALGIGLLIGSTTLEDPIRQMTSGRYKVDGTLDEPQVKFLGMFETDLSDASELQLPSPSDEQTKATSEEPAAVVITGEDDNKENAELNTVN